MADEIQGSNLRIATPDNLDKIFSLECFKYLEMKGLFKTIFEHMNKLGISIEKTNARLNGVPDPNDIANMIQRLAKCEGDIGTFNKEIQTAKDARGRLSSRIDELLE